MALSAEWRKDLGEKVGVGGQLGGCALCWRDTGDCTQQQPWRWTEVEGFKSWPIENKTNPTQGWIALGGYRETMSGMPPRNLAVWMDGQKDIPWDEGPWRRYRRYSVCWGSRVRMSLRFLWDPHMEIRRRPSQGRTAACIAMRSLSKGCSRTNPRMSHLSLQPPLISSSWIFLQGDFLASRRLQDRAACLGSQTSSCMSKTSVFLKETARKNKLPSWRWRLSVDTQEDFLAPAVWHWNALVSRSQALLPPRSLTTGWIAISWGCLECSPSRKQGIGPDVWPKLPGPGWLSSSHRDPIHLVTIAPFTTHSCVQAQRLGALPTFPPGWAPALWGGGRPWGSEKLGDSPEGTQRKKHTVDWGPCPHFSSAFFLLSHFFVANWSTVDTY